jgi:hypothetical protein
VLVLIVHSFRDVGVVIREQLLLARYRADATVGQKGRHHAQRQERSRQVRGHVKLYFAYRYRYRYLY